MFSVLIADDMKYIRKSLINRVDWGSLNLKVVGEVGDGQQALDFIITQKPHIVLIDIKMPIYSGLEVIAKVRQLPELNGVKFLLVTSYDDFKYTKTGIKLGVEDYIKKPVDIQDLEETLQAVVKKVTAEVLQQTEISENLNEIEKVKTTTFLSDMISLTPMRTVYKDWKQSPNERYILCVALLADYNFKADLIPKIECSTEQFSCYCFSSYEFPQILCILYHYKSDCDETLLTTHYHDFHMLHYNDVITFVSSNSFNVIQDLGKRYQLLISQIKNQVLLKNLGVEITPPDIVEFFLTILPH